MTSYDIWDLLDKLASENDITHVIQGGADGADRLGKDWAHMSNIPYSNYPALWHKHGKRAGPLRNQQMLDEGKPNLVIGFTTPESRGTWDMIRRAKNANVEVIIHEYKEKLIGRKE